ncbi:hypothetical protein SUGI_0136240 [Cryptomeria japonica]|uniref:uncharacterized protein At1g01500 n=1 Tax=Cryptomeria japonica TaxID=3369 RepID=UPI002408C65D|nr:uncharacterized protein At1g01500 [Cryptomeria japonica]GLJ10837.1 hypothetical protein SUGI_0136240 [Cryptomeria japonica]
MDTQRQWSGEMVSSHHKISSLSFPSANQSDPWFDIRVVCVKLSSCLVKCAPEYFRIVFPPRSVSSSLEVNGERISHSERTSRALRRDRLDKESAEATYVSTDDVRAKGDLPFEIHHKGDVLVAGKFLRSDSWTEGHLLDSHACSFTTRKKLWIMDCNCALSAGSSFLSTKTDHFSAMKAPFLEVYVAGRSLGQPIVLNQTVQLLPRRKNTRCISLDAIPEDDDEIVNTSSFQYQGEMDSEVEQGRSDRHGVEVFYCNEGLDVDGEEGELSWFNAGVRVGMGIGLGICLGVGVGVGLLVRTYQATTGPFKRRPL